LDPTKNADDIANYDAEFTQLQSQLVNIKAESFNGINLFTEDSNITVYTSEEGDASGEPSVMATRTGLFQELGNVQYDGTDATPATNSAYSVAEYNDQVGYTASTDTATTFVKSTGDDGTIRFGYIANDADDANTSTGDVDITANNHGVSFADAVTAGDIVEIDADKVSLIYDAEADTARARVFDASMSTHDAGDLVFDADSGEFYIAVGATQNYTDATAAAADIATNPGQFDKLEHGFAKVSDYDEFSTSQEYKLGDIVAHNDKLYVANGSTANTIAAGKDVPSNSTEFTELSAYAVSGADLLTSTNTLSNYSIGDFTSFIQNAATARAQNGAEMARLESSVEMLKANQGNLDAARSRLAVVDVALESTNLAKQNILVQSAAAMLSQANASQNVALQLLG